MAKKIGDRDFEVDEIVPEVSKKVQFNMDFLKKQLSDIQAQQDSDNAKREAEKQYVLAKIAEGESVGVSKDVQPDPIIP